MNADKKTKTTNKKQWQRTTSKKVQKTVWTNNDAIERENIGSPDTSVSVFTRTTNPKVIIKSENIKNGWDYECNGICNKHRLLKLICMMIMCVIILMTFFLVLKTYNNVNELSEYFMS